MVEPPCARSVAHEDVGVAAVDGQTLQNSPSGLRPAAAAAAAAVAVLSSVDAGAGRRASTIPDQPESSCNTHRGNKLAHNETNSARAPLALNLAVLKVEPGSRWRGVAMSCGRRGKGVASSKVGVSIIKFHHERRGEHKWQVAVLTRCRTARP